MPTEDTVIMKSHTPDVALLIYLSHTRYDLGLVVMKTSTTCLIAASYVIWQQDVVKVVMLSCKRLRIVTQCKSKISKRRHNTSQNLSIACVTDMQLNYNFVWLFIFCFRIFRHAPRLHWTTKKHIFNQGYALWNSRWQIYLILMTKNSPNSSQRRNVSLMKNEWFFYWEESEKMLNG